MAAGYDRWLCKSGNPSALKKHVIITALDADESFQAMPLGAACIASALTSDSMITGQAEISLLCFSRSSPGFSSDDAGEAGRFLAERIIRDTGCEDTAPESIAVGFSVFVWNRVIMESAAKILRERLPGVLLFAGGPEITAGAQTPGIFDYTIARSGEQQTINLISTWLSGNPSIQSDNTVSSCLEILPSPWLDGTLACSPVVSEGRGALWELSRGCPFSCSYCYESRGEKKVQYVPLERLKKELAFFVEKGIERVFVLDPTYNASKKRALEILSLIETYAGDIQFNFEVRAEYIDHELADAFSRIPCSLQIGLQSSNERALTLVNRPVDFKKFAAGITQLNKKEIVFGFDLIYGLPGDTLKTFKKTLDYAVARYPNNLEIFRLAVLPGTALYDQAEELSLVYDKEPPYHIVSTPAFPQRDIDRAERIARAADFFYTRGRAVSWFLAALFPLNIKPSRFFTLFSAFPGYQNLRNEDDPDHRTIEKIQLSFLEQQYREAGCMHLFPAVKDLVSLYGAWTRAFAEGETTELELSWHPDDLFSPDALDITGFVEYVVMELCCVRVFPTPDGVEYTATNFVGNNL